MAADPGLTVAEGYAALDEERHRLCLAWQDVENWLFQHSNWAQLTPAQQAAAPEGAQLRALEDQLAVIEAQHAAQLLRVQTTPACTRAGVFARLEALARLLSLREPQDAYTLLQSCRSDLERLWP